MVQHSFRWDIFGSLLTSLNHLACAVFAQWGTAKKLQKCPLCKSPPLSRSKIERIRCTPTLLPSFTLQTDKALSVQQGSCMCLDCRDEQGHCTSFEHRQFGRLQWSTHIPWHIVSAMCLLTLCVNVADLFKNCCSTHLFFCFPKKHEQRSTMQWLHQHAKKLNEKRNG